MPEYYQKNPFGPENDPENTELTREQIDANYMRKAAEERMKRDEEILAEYIPRLKAIYDVLNQLEADQRPTYFVMKVPGSTGNPKTPGINEKIEKGIGKLPEEFYAIERKLFPVDSSVGEMGIEEMLILAEKINNLLQTLPEADRPYGFTLISAKGDNQTSTAIRDRFYEAGLKGTSMSGRVAKEVIIPLSDSLGKKR